MLCPLLSNGLTTEMKRGVHTLQIAQKKFTNKFAILQRDASIASTRTQVQASPILQKGMSKFKH